MTTSDLASAFEAQCLQALSRREHSKGELLAKKAAELDEESAVAVIEGLAERGVIAKAMCAAKAIAATAH